MTTKAKQFQVLGSYTHSWSELSGTWQPGDPASFIQPNAFPFNQGLGTNDNRSAASANGLAASAGDPGWTPQITRLAVVCNAPWSLITSISYSRQSGLSSGPILTQIAAADPQFGPPTVTLSNGRIVSNPLATTIRFAFPTRSDGQYQPAAGAEHLQRARRSTVPAPAQSEGRDRREHLQPWEPRRILGLPVRREPAVQHQLRQGRQQPAAGERAAEYPVPVLEADT